MIRIGCRMRQKLEFSAVLLDEAQIGQHRSGKATGRGILEQVGIDRGMTHPARGQGFAEGRNVDKLAAIVVDQHRAFVHARQDIRADEPGIGVAAGLRILLAQADMNTQHIGTISRIEEIRRIDKAFGLYPVPMPGPCVDHHAHAEGLGKFGHLPADIAVADDRDRLAFELFGREIAQLPAGVEGAARHPVVKQVHREIRQHFQDRLHHHLRRGAAVDAGRIHQHGRTAFAAAAAPGVRTHIAGAGADADAGERKDGFGGQEGRGGNDGIIASIAGDFDQLFAGAEVRLIEEMHAARFESGLVAKRSRMKAAALGFDMRTHLRRVGLSVGVEAQADQIADQHGVGALRIDRFNGAGVGICDHVGFLRARAESCWSGRL